MILQLITDRTASDLMTAESIVRMRWAELREDQRQAYLAGFRGTYGPADLNRVEEAVDILATLFRGLPAELESYAAEAGADWSKSDLPYDPESLDFTTKTNWTPADMFPTAERARYISNVRVLRDTFAPEMPLPYTLDGLTWQGANDIEAALMAVEAAYERIREEYMEIIENEANSLKIRSGEAFAGEVTA